MLSTTIIFRRFSTAHPTGPRFRLALRTIHGSHITRRQRDAPNPASHGAENYFVDGDDTPPPDNPIYKVDATSDVAQSAYEPPSGPWSRAGAGTKEYGTVSKDEPYEVSNAPDVKLRYGGVKRYVKDEGPETSKAGEGPEGTERWGRKPEGRT